VELLEAVAALRPDETASFALPGLPASWSAARQEAVAAIARLHDGINARGIVETRAAGTLIARTYLDVLGAERTVWRPDCTADQAALHQRTVSLCVASRIALVSMLAAAVRGATRIAAAVTLPGGPVLLVPAVLRFIAAAARDTAAHSEPASRPGVMRRGAG
jgi:hypothetical protein